MVARNRNFVENLQPLQSKQRKRHQNSPTEILKRMPQTPNKTTNNPKQPTTPNNAMQCASTGHLLGVLLHFDQVLALLDLHTAIAPAAACDGHESIRVGEGEDGGGTEEAAPEHDAVIGEGG